MQLKKAPLVGAFFILFIKWIGFLSDTDFAIFVRYQPIFPKS